MHEELNSLRREHDQIESALPSSTRGLYRTSRETAQRLKAAAKELDESNIQKTLKNLMEYSKVSSSAVYSVFSKIKGLRDELGVIDEYQFDEFQYRVIATTFHDLGLDVSDEAFADILQKDIKVVRLYFKRHADLREELRVVLTAQEKFKPKRVKG